MKKDAFYFPHFSNARNDSKIIKLRRVLGLEGYAIYFMLLEVLREQSDFKYPLVGIEDLAFEWHISKEKIFTVIQNFELFQIFEDDFFSSKMVLYLQPYIEKSQRAREASNKRWQTVNNQLNVSNANVDANEYANAIQMDYICNTNADASKVKERKVNKTKEEKDIFSKIEKPKEEKSLEYQNITKELWERWITFKKTQFKDTYKSIDSEQTALNHLIKISKNDLKIATEIVNNSIANLYKGLFELKNNQANTSSNPKDANFQQPKMKMPTW